jgi:hypothetical protein
MPRYRIHRMKDAPRENFRWAAHTGGAAILKAKDYDTAEEVEAGNPYELWKTMAETGRSLHPGDVLERLDLEIGSDQASGGLQVAKYIGFEPARWFVPEPKPNVADVAASTVNNSSEPTETCLPQALADRN